VTGQVGDDELPAPDGETPPDGARLTDLLAEVQDDSLHAVAHTQERVQGCSMPSSASPPGWTST
jgi:hypothetical protein